MTYNEINEQCLPIYKKPKRIIGAMAVTIEKIKNRRGEIIEAYEKVTVIGSRHGYQIRNNNGIEIYCVNHDSIRFFKNEYQKL